MAVDLAAQLQGCSKEELAGMCERLARSRENLDELYEQLQEDQRQLKEENTKLQEDISLMISCTKPLCIGANNTVTPEIDEAPLAFVGRWWEMVKPRTTGVQVNEHLGEIRKDPSAVGEDGDKLYVERNEAVGTLKGAWGSLKSSDLFQQGKALAATGVQKARESGAIDATQGAWASLRQTAGSTWAQLNREPERPKRTKKRSRRKEEGGGYAKNPEMPCQKAVSSTAADAAASSADASQSAASASNSGDAQAADESSKSPSGATFEPETPSEAFEDAPSAERHSVKADLVEEKAEDFESPPEEDDEENGDDQMSSTVLIEAHLTLGDGSVQTIRVRAADRCKEVAQRFVKEHSLKNLFVQPLTDYLKQVENDAEKFPVSVHADLMQIYGGA